VSTPIGRRLDNVVHQRVRLGILTVLNEAERADFAFLRDTLELTDGNLSSNRQVLSRPATSRSRRVRRPPPANPDPGPRAGRTRLKEEIAVLESIVARVNGSRLGR
jgi:winged helix DNA-binding protein